MSYKKYLNDKLKKRTKNFKLALVFISPERVNIIAEASIFFLILLSCYSFYILPPWYTSLIITFKCWCDCNVSLFISINS